MLNLETKIKLDAGICHETNLTSRFSEDDLRRIGDWCWDGYDRDTQSRAAWQRRTQAAMDLALQLQKDKNFPWVNCSNVAFPLITIAAMEFHSRAYPALTPGTGIAKCRVVGPDPTGALTAKALRIGKFMSYQLSEEDQAWEEQQDRLLLQLPIVGCVFKKSRHLPREQKNISDVVPASKLVFDYFAKSVESCMRKTHILEMYRNEVYEKCRSGVFRDVLGEAWYKSPAAPMIAPGDVERDKRLGIAQPMADDATPLTFLEQHCWMDADDDGYAEPYIITFDGVSKNVVRIVARWEDPADVEYSGKHILRINATEQFTKYELIPSPDGGVLGMGFGVLLGPLNESVNTIVNQLIDAGTLANTSGGFLSRGVKIRGGAYTFQPFGWNRVDSTGDDLQKGIYPFPVREPSNVLFTLLQFLVNYTQRISGSTDMLAGENPGQNTPAGTSQEMVIQGMKIYSALFKRVWRCLREELRKLYILNARYLPVSRPFGDGGTISREDFLGDPSQVAPAADPNVVSEGMRIQLALMISERARMIPGYDIAATEKNLHAAMNLEGAEVLYPGPDKVPPLPNPKVQVEQMKLEVKKADLEQRKQEFIATLQEEQQVNQATIVKLMADAELAAAQAQSVDNGHQIAMIEAMIGMAKQRNEHIRGQVDLLLKSMEIDNERRAIEKQPAGNAGK